MRSSVILCFVIIVLTSSSVSLIYWTATNICIYCNLQLIKAMPAGRSGIILQFSRITRLRTPLMSLYVLQLAKAKKVLKSFNAKNKDFNIKFVWCDDISIMFHTIFMSINFNRLTGKPTIENHGARSEIKNANFLINGQVHRCTLKFGGKKTKSPRNPILKCGKLLIYWSKSFIHFRTQKSEF